MKNDWPVRRTAKDLVKPCRTARKVHAHKERRTRKTTEDTNKRAAKKRDGYRCRFPLCGCAKLKLALHASHQVHAGMGGDKTGARAQPDNLITLCAHRHMAGAFSRHAGTLRVICLTDKGTDGSVEFCVDRWLLYTHGYDIPLRDIELRSEIDSDGFPVDNEQWVVIARERAVQQLEDLKPWQRSVLTAMAEMTL